MNIRFRSVNRCFLKMNRDFVNEQKRINRGLNLGFEIIDKFLVNGGILSKYITRYTDKVFINDDIILKNCFYIFTL